eukprot:TRINITY_DN124153_c0_g1_i1.p1 TRINITY_DN124153_c0_g1~~TRINITY_DN124153_c0_g1_i1.p1  ORF type:complete len:431 (+),score=38.75 TRINITY_DN124153_c0_g1_i1:136-1428(+)
MSHTPGMASKASQAIAPRWRHSLHLVSDACELDLTSMVAGGSCAVPKAYLTTEEPHQPAQHDRMSSSPFVIWRGADTERLQEHQQPSMLKEHVRAVSVGLADPVQPPVPCRTVVQPGARRYYVGTTPSAPSTPCQVRAPPLFLQPATTSSLPGSVRRMASPTRLLQVREPILQQCTPRWRYHTFTPSSCSSSALHSSTVDFPSAIFRTTSVDTSLGHYVQSVVPVVHRRSLSERSRRTGPARHLSRSSSAGRAGEEDRLPASRSVSPSRRDERRSSRDRAGEDSPRRLRRDRAASTPSLAAAARPTAEGRLLSTTASAPCLVERTEKACQTGSTVKSSPGSEARYWRKSGGRSLRKKPSSSLLVLAKDVEDFLGSLSRATTGDLDGGLVSTLAAAAAIDNMLPPQKELLTSQGSWWLDDMPRCRAPNRAY